MRPTVKFFPIFLFLIMLHDQYYLVKVNWVQGDATEIKTVEKALKDADAAVHAIGMFSLS